MHDLQPELSRGACPTGDAPRRRPADDALDFPPSPAQLRPMIQRQPSYVYAYDYATRSAGRDRRRMR
jgi:hypothetical protein